MDFTLVVVKNKLNFSENFLTENYWYDVSTQKYQLLSIHRIKSRIRETLNLSTYADQSSNTIQN